MPINAEYEKYVGERTVARLTSQSIVENKFTSKTDEVVKVLAVNANAVLTGAEAGSGEVRYSGMIYYTIVYKNDADETVKTERGTEFSYKAECGECAPSCSLKIGLRADKTDLTREGRGVLLSTVVTANIEVGKAEATEYLTGGEGLVCKSGIKRVVRRHCAKGVFELEEGFESEYISDVLLHSENCIINSVKAGVGEVQVGGEINVALLVKRCDENGCKIFSLERNAPFAFEVPCDEASPEQVAEAEVKIKGATINAEADEKKDRCKIVIETALEISTVVYEPSELFAAEDAFCKSCNSTCVTERVCDEEYLYSLNKTERVSGVALLSEQLPQDARLEAIMLQNAEVYARAVEDGCELQGEIAAHIIYVNENERGSIKASVPLKTVLDDENAKKYDRLSVNALCSGFSARLKSSGELVCEATVKYVVRCYVNTEFSYIAAVKEGDGIPPNENAITVYVPQKGDSLWNIARRLRKSESEVLTANPHLDFPLKGDERIIVYRRRSD